MTDDEFWHRLALGRLMALMEDGQPGESDEAQMRALEAAGY